MKLSLIFENSRIFTLCNGDEKETLLTDLHGSLFIKKNECSIELSKYSLDKIYGVLGFSGESLSIFLKRGVSISSRNLIRSGNVFFYFSNKVIELDSITKDLLLDYCLSGSYHLIPNIVSTSVEVDERIKTAVLNLSSLNYELFDFGAEAIEDPMFLEHQLSCSHLALGLSLGNERLVKKNTFSSKKENPNLKPDQRIWNLEKRRVCYNGSIVIASLGSIRQERDSDTIVSFEQEDQKWMAPDPYYTDGHLYGVASETGEKKWLAVFDYQVEDFVLLPSGKLCVISERYLYLLDPETGEIHTKFDTGIRKKERIETVSIRLLVHKDKLIITSLKDCSLQIRNADSLELLREIDAREEKWGFAKYPIQVAGDLVFVPVQLGESPLIGGAMLLMDMNNIDAPIEVEQGPEFEEVMPSKENPASIKISTNHPDWGTTLRFLERRLLELILIASGKPQYKYFKPRTAEFTYSGFDEDVDLVREKMEIFKERFREYLSEPRIPGISIGEVEFTYKLIE